MGLVEDFPENPFVPTLRYAATQLIPLRLPCGRNPIPLGSSLAVSYKKDEKSSMSASSAFSKSSLESSRIIFSSGSGGSVTQVSHMGGQSRTTHLNFSVHAEIGGDFLGAEVSLNYEKNTADSHNSINATSQSSYQAGRAMFAETPRLSLEATNILRKSQDPHKDFKERYGEYYVSAYILGGRNANTLGAMMDTSSSSMDLDGQVKIKVFFAKITVGFSKHESSFSQSVNVSLVAHDTLDHWECYRAATDAGSYNELVSIASQNGANGSILAHRVTQRLESLGLVSGQELSWDACESMFQNGVVVEILLLPYARLRQYNEVIMAGGVRSVTTF